MVSDGRSRGARPPGAPPGHVSGRFASRSGGAHPDFAAAGWEPSSLLLFDSSFSLDANRYKVRRVAIRRGRGGCENVFWTKFTDQCTVSIKKVLSHRQVWQAALPWSTSQTVTFTFITFLDDRFIKRNLDSMRRPNMNSH